MNGEFERALDQCLGWLRDGSDVDTCLGRYPAFADDLRPLLVLAAGLRRAQVPAPSAEARTAGRQRMLAALSDRRSLSQGAGLRSRLSRRLRRALDWAGRRPVWQMAVVLLVALLFFGGGATVAAAANSLPGDSLYPVKLASQNVRVVLALGSAQRRQVEIDIQEERLQDVREVLAKGRRVNVEFEAEVEEMLDGVWRIGGLPAIVQATTDVSGEPYLGAGVRVRGYLPGNGQIVITQLDVEDLDSPEEPQDPLEPATATAIEEPTEPAGTLEPPEHPEPTAILQPTAQPQPTQTPGSTPQPTETHEPGDTPHPTETQSPSKTPHPTETHRPSETPHPTHTPEPSPTPGATPTAELTEHPEHPTGAPGATPTQEH